MSLHPAHDLMPSRTNCFALETQIAYFERRLNETTAQADEAAGGCSHAAHAGLAELYRLELSQLRTGPEITAPASPLLEQAREAGVIEGSADGTARPKLTLGSRRNS